MKDSDLMNNFNQMLRNTAAKQNSAREAKLDKILPKANPKYRSVCITKHHNETDYYKQLRNFPEIK